MKYFVTAIDTDSGKTLTSAILCEAFQADYWKPIQAGFPRDADVVKGLISNTKSVIHPETFLLNTPASPHAAAKIDGVEIRIEDFKLPQTENSLIIEGAGGCLVPLNNTDFIIDLIPHLNAEAILVSDLYLGSINHTLLTIEALKNRNIPIKGLIFNGEGNNESEHIILHHSHIPCLLRIKREHVLNAALVTSYASILKENWQ